MSIFGGLVSCRDSVAVLVSGQAGKSHSLHYTDGQQNLGRIGYIYLLNKAETFMDLKGRYKWDIFLPSLLGPGCSLVLRSPPSSAEPCAEPVDTCFLYVSFPGKYKGLNFPRNLIATLRACLTLHSVSNSDHLPRVSVAVAALPPREGFQAHSPCFPRQSLTTSLKNYPQRRKTHFPFPQQPCQGFCLSALVLQASVLIPSVTVTAD